MRFLYLWADGFQSLQAFVTRSAVLETPYLLFRGLSDLLLGRRIRNDDKCHGW